MGDLGIQIRSRARAVVLTASSPPRIHFSEEPVPVRSGGRPRSSRLDRRSPVRRCYALVYTSGLGAAPDHPIDFFRTKYAIEQYLKASDWHYVHIEAISVHGMARTHLQWKTMLEKGRTTLLGSGTKLRNFIAASDVSHFAVLALTAPTVVQRILEIGGPGNFTNNDVAQLYAKTARIEPRVRHVHRRVASTLALLSRPFQPGLSRVMRLASLPDDAFSESFDPTNLLRDYPTRLTRYRFVCNEVMRARKL